MSLIFGAIAGGLAGGGAAGEKALGRMQEHEQQKSLEELRAELMFEKQSRLAEIQHGYDVAMEKDVRQPYQSAEAKKERDFRTEEATAQREFSQQQLGVTLQYDFMKLKAQLDDSALDRKSRERVANAQIAASKTQLQVDGTGAIWSVDMKSGKATAVKDSETGEAIRAKTDLTASQLLMINLQKGWAESVIKSDTATPEEKAAAKKMLTETLPRAAAGNSPSPTNEALAALYEQRGNPEALAAWDAKWKKLGFPVETSLAYYSAEAAKKAEEAAKKPGAPDAPDAPGADPKPIPANAPPGLVEAARRGEATVAAETKAAADKKAAKAADTKARTADVEWLTPARIRGMTGAQAREYRNKYWDVLTPEQRRALTIQTGR